MTQTLEFIPPLLEASVVTVEITILSAALAFVLAFVAGLARLSRLWVVRALASAYIEFFRGTSLLVQLFWLFYVLPHFGLTLPPLSVISTVTTEAALERRQWLAFAVVPPNDPNA